MFGKDVISNCYAQRIFISKINESIWQKYFIMLGARKILNFDVIILERNGR